MNQQSKKIFEPLVIVSNASSGGGAEKAMLTLHQEFVNKGVDCHLIALNQSLPSSKVYNLRVLNRNWKDGIVSTYLSFLHLRKILKEINPKSIIVNCELPELCISLMRLKQIRIIVVEHTTYPWYKKRALGLFVRELLKIKKTEWVTVSKNKNYVWHATGIPRYIPNPFTDINKSVRQNSEESSLVFIGGMKENKRPEWVIMAALKNNLEVNIFGTGDLEDYLKKKYAKYPHLIKFNGYKENVWEQVPKRSLVIVPSVFEGDGMVVVEATILGFPLLLSSNIDLLRFGFQDKHYFRDFDDLICKIARNKNNGFSDLIVDDEAREVLLVNRSVKTIASMWQEFLLEGNP